MIVMRTVHLVMAFLFGVITTFAVDLPQGVKVGDTAPDFTLKNIDLQTVGLKSYKEAKGLIVVFTCNHCPYSVKYEERIKALHAEFASKGFPVVAINSNDTTVVPEDSFENMILRAKEKEFTFPYLIDPSQNTAKAYGARKTPHVFVLNKTRAGFIVEYIGTIDENPDDATQPGQTFVVDAVNSLLAGQKPTATMTKAIGCTIKWKK